MDSKSKDKCIIIIATVAVKKNESIYNNDER